MRNNTRNSLQTLYVIILFVSFLLFFGISNIQKFMKDESIVVESYEYLEEPIQAPSMTIVPFNSETSSQWKNYTAQSPTAACKFSIGEDEITKCIDANTFSLEESLLSIKQVNGSEITTNLSSYFSSRMEMGKFYTLKQNFSISTAMKSRKYGGLGFNLDESLGFMVSITDDNYYLFSVDPAAVPGIRIHILSKAFASKRYTLKVTKHIKRNTAQRPCNNNAEYSFTNCVRDGIERNIGCSLPWNYQAHPTLTKLPTCSAIAQFELHIQAYNFIGGADNIDRVIDHSGCKLPCTFLEYSIAEELPEESKSDMLSLKFCIATDKVLVKTEVKRYEFGNLVGDTGGSLGLFLGFSFMTIWDWLCSLADILRKHILTSCK